MTRMPGAMINRNMFTQVNQDSGSLTPATTVVHRFSERGAYKGVVMDGRGVAVGEFSIRVGEEEAKERRERAGSASLPPSIQVDLTSSRASQASAIPVSGCEGCGDEQQGGELRVAPEGYAVFKVPAGAAGGYAVELYESGESGRGEKEFDSRALGRKDLLAVLLLRPGTYAVTNATNGTKAELEVAYPEKAIGILEPVRVVCEAGGIRPGAIKVHPTQGLVFSFETPSRLKIELASPEDRARPSAPAAAHRAAISRTAKRHPRRLYLYPRRGVRR